MREYYLHRYTEVPHEQKSKGPFISLEEARQKARDLTGGAEANYDLESESYNDGTYHVEAYYDDEKHLTGWWLTATLHD